MTVLREVPYDECLAMLALQRVGRVAVVRDRYPLVFPVNFVMDGTDIVFRTGSRTQLMPFDGEHVGFEVDHIDHDRHTGWSVLARGIACHVTDTAAVRPEPWAEGQHPVFVRIRTHGNITGRWLDPRELDPVPTMPDPDPDPDA